MTEIFHNSHDSVYRNPFGAVPTGTDVEIRLKVTADSAVTSVFLRVFKNGESENIPMKEVSGMYRATLQAGDDPRLIWYDFIVNTKAETLYYTNNSQGLGGIGQTMPYETANGYQITVYDKSYNTPQWFRGSIMYQIFPDRFYGVHKNFEIPKKRQEYTIHYDWYEPISFNRHPFEDGVAWNDFYGGNLKGIQEKLPYLKSLGVGVLYLNPIFDAYSNHKYDTADYKTIDPMFGTEEDFKNLCSKAESMGIRIILDGVFSHTGADSVYFNKYGNYGENSGAYRDINSPYHSWYQFTDYPNYDSWWGCNNLPNVNEMEESYLDYILRDKESVVKKWLKCGAYGWRLDVADELPDEFIKILRKEVKSQNPDGVIIGEVWEDASNKTAYNKLREYLWGFELDSVMNYPFKDSVLSFLMNGIDGNTLNSRIMSQIENYPAQTLYSLMNILGTHDTMRVKSLLGGMGEDCKTQKMSSGLEDLATKRLQLASFMQMTFYGVPCIYYGDEVGMQGGKDPYNRGTYPWRMVDTELRDWYKYLGNLRNTTLCLKNGFFTPVIADGDLYGYIRHFKNGVDPFGENGDESFAFCLVNRSFEERTTEVDLSSFEISTLTDVISGDVIGESNGVFNLTIPPLSARCYMKNVTQA